MYEMACPFDCERCPQSQRKIQAPARLKSASHMLFVSKIRKLKAYVRKEYGTLKRVSL